MSEQPQPESAEQKETGFARRIDDFRKSKRYQRLIRHSLSYFVLALGAAFMLFPMLWMISSSFKPPWQIFTNPPIWFPNRWETTTCSRYQPRVIDLAGAGG